MKHSLLYLTIIAFLTACSSDPKQGLTTGVTVLTPQNNPGAYSNTFSDTGTISGQLVSDEKAILPSTVKRRIVKPIRRVESNSPDQPTETVYQPQPQAPVSTIPQSTPEPVVVPAPASTNNTGSSTSTDNAGKSETPTTIPEIKKEKKGWSKAAQGAVIGGVAGAVGGAILSKNKGKGAIIGGVVGAAGGYILGRSKDKKDNQFVSN